jgi:ADP-ribosylation factor-like protein 2
MGNYASEEKHGLVTGLDGAGKTTLLCRLAEDTPVSEIPTIGSFPVTNCLGVKWLDIDLGGQEKYRNYMRTLWSNSHYVIFVADLSNRDNLPTVKYELNRLFEDDVLKDSKFLIVGNKSDMEGCMTGTDLIDKLDLHEHAHRNWEIMECSATRNCDWRQRIAEFVMA